MILTNELPRLSDASGAIVSRIILLHTTKSFYGREDHGLTDAILGRTPRHFAVGNRGVAAVTRTRAVRSTGYGTRIAIGNE